MTKPTGASSEFVAEAQEIVDALNRDLIAVEQESRSGEVDPDRVNNLFRSAHSLKGISGMFGLDAMSRLAHDLENVLDGMRLGKLQLNAEALDVLFACVERFTDLIDAAAKNKRRDVATVQDLVTRLDAVVHGSSAAKESDPLSTVAIGEEVLSVLTEYEEHRLRENVRRQRKLYMLRTAFDLSDFDVGLAEIDAAVKTLGEVITKLPSSKASDPGTISFDIIVGSEQTAEALRLAVTDDRVEILPIRYKSSAPAVGEVSEAPPKTPGAVADAEAEAVALHDDRGDEGEEHEEGTEGESSNVRRVSQTVRVDIRRLDELMNLVGELALTKAAFQRISDEMKREHGFTGLAVELHKESRNFERRLAELQAGIMEVRMVPLGNLFERMVRVARKIARELSREVRIDVSGEHTELDKLIVEDLADPLMHLIRNSIDHGLETPEERLAAGKEREGVIRLSAAAQGNHVIVSVLDDGRGIDVEKTLEMAVRKGLVTRERAQEMGKREVYNLLFLPGFSTREEVSEYSGRGVGLDVVKTNISKLSGIIEVESVPGAGTTVTVTLPITLAIIPALVVSIAGTIYAIPLNNVQETLALAKQQVRTIEQREVISLRGATVPLVDLRAVFNLQSGPRPNDGFGVVVGVGINRMSVFVDTLIGQQDIVIKSLGRRLRRVRGIAGATELGDQRTILVIDTVELLNELSTEEASRVEA